MMQYSYLVPATLGGGGGGRCCVLTAACLALVKYALWRVCMFVEWLDLVSGIRHSCCMTFWVNK